ncbi:MAG: ZIP family metal transporter [Candidatus Melainabacteria bacterium]|nr:ZIP family metal transporter [Candidatus Melainabacteria bacterium]
MENWAIALTCALAVSLVSLLGVATFSLSGQRQRKIINLLLSLAAGAMLGNALLHLLPHALEAAGRERPAIVEVAPAASHQDNAGRQEPEILEPEHDHDHEHGSAPVNTSQEHHHEHDHVSGHPGLSVIALLLLGFLALFGLDLTLLTFAGADKEGVKPLGYLVLLSDGLENFLDGLVMGAAFLVSVPAGLAVSLAIFLHEIPMELGDYAVLRHAGFSSRKALLLNFVSAIVNVLGLSLAFLLGGTLPGFTSIATPLAAGAMLYLAASGLVPQLRMQGGGWQKLSYFGMTLLGVAVMAGILLLE